MLNFVIYAVRIIVIYSPIFKGQEVQEEFLNLEDETDKLSRTFGTELSFYAA
jgi:hypothetical protein